MNLLRNRKSLTKSASHTQTITKNCTVGFDSLNLALLNQVSGRIIVLNT